MKTETKRWAIAIVGVLLVLGLLVGVKAGQIGAMIRADTSFVPPPEAITSARVGAIEWQGMRAAIGSLVAARGVTLSAELPGVVREIAFESGASVRTGDLLVKLDTSAEKAQLDAALAEASLARINLARARALREGGSNSPADLDAAEARAKQAGANVANFRATIAKKVIRAPFDGRISIRQIELGQAISSGTPIASLVSVSPIHADFWLPQQALAETNVGQGVRVRIDTFPGASWDGRITAVNPEVAAATRNVRVRATFPNPDGRLRPGMFANVEIFSSEKRSALVIPATAAIFAPYYDSVFVLEEKKDHAGNASTVAQQRLVRLGERRGDFVAVTSGLSAGETVATSGAFKLRNGMAVVVNNAIAPGAELTPKPAER